MSVKSIVIKAVAGVLILAALIGVAVWLSSTAVEEGKDPAAPQKLLEASKSNESEVIRIDITGQNSFSLYLDENASWVLEGMEGIDVNTAYANALRKSITSVSSPMLVEENVEDISKYGLDNPICKVKITFVDGEKELHVGNVSGEYHYFKAADSSDVYIVLKNDLYMVFMDKMRYLDTHVVSIDTAQIAAVEYGNVKLEKVGDYWFEKSPYNRLADDAAVKSRIITALSNINADSIVKKSTVTIGNLNSVTVKTLSGEVVEFAMCPAEDGYSYVVKDSSEYVYVVKSSALRFIDVTGFELISKYVAPINIRDVEKLELIAPGKKHVIDIEAPASEAPVFYFDGEEAVESTVREFYAKVVGLTFKGEGSATAAAEYAFIFTLTDGTKTDIRFISVSQTDYAISIDGKTRFTIAKKTVTDVFDSIRLIETI